MTTVYTFHRAEDGEILATGNVENLQQVAATVARNLATDGIRSDRYVHVHNGRGIICTGLCRGGEWRDMPQTNYSSEPTAREKRAAAGWPNDATP